MKTRTISLLLGAILLLGLVAILADRTEKASRQSSASGKLLPGFDAARAQKLEIKTRGAAVTLGKQDGLWRVLPEGQPADEAAVKETLDKLAAAEKAELASSNPEKHSALEVKEGEDKGVELKVWTADKGDPAVHLFVGKAGGDFASNFVRLAGEQTVYRAREALRTALDRPRGWRDRTIVKFVKEDATRLELHSAAGRWVFVRAADAKDAPWTWLEPEIAPAQSAAVDAIVAQLSNLQVDEFPTGVDPVAAGIAEPGARSIVTLKDGRSLEVLWGGEAAQGSVYVKRADAPEVFEVASYKKTSVFPALDRLQVVPSPAPAPAPEATPAATP